MDTHLYNTVINLYVKRKMHTKMLNTELLNNAAATSHLPVHHQSANNGPHPFIPQEDTHQDHQQPMVETNNNNYPSSSTTTINSSSSAAPPLPPRSLMQSSAAVAAAVSPSQPALAVDLSLGPGDVSLPGEPSLHTHSSKFPIEREVIVKNSRDKQCKIPNLSDYMRRAKPSIAPDAPPKQLAWTQQKSENNDNQMGFAQDIAAHQVYKAQPLLMDSSKEEPSPIRPLHSQESPGLVTSTPEQSDGARALPQRTYQSIKDMISSRFSKQQQQHSTASSSTVAPSTSQKPNVGAVASSLETSLSPQSQLRQHGVYIGPPPTTPSLQPQTGASALPQSLHHVEMRQSQSHQQQQRMFEQQQRNRFQQPQGSPSGYNYYQQVSYQQQQNQQYQTYNNVDGSVSKSQSVENVLGPSYPYSNGIDGGCSKSYSQENVMNTPYGPSGSAQSRPPLSHQYRSGKTPAPLPSTSSRFPPPSSSTTPLYSNQEYQQTCATVHAPQDGPPVDAKTQQQQQQQQQRGGEPPFRDTAAALAGPSLSKQDDDDEGGFVKRGGQSGDSGRGSTVYSSAKTSAEDATPPITGEVQEWTDRVETELRQILENGGAGDEGVGSGGVNGTSLANGGVGGAGGSTESFSSVSPPLPPLSPHSSDETFRRPRLGGGYNAKMWSSRSKDKSRSHKHGKSNLLSSGLEIDSMLDENNSSDDDDYTDTRAIRKQLESLETMYAQVLKMLGVKRPHHMRYEASDPRVNKRRPCGGSISSVPSSVSSRPVRFSDRRARAAKVKDIKGINKRFQRLESHVVTLARSVAHLSSEMRTQHVMMQEMEMMRGELAALRIQTNVTQQQQCQTNTMVGNHLLNSTGGGAGPRNNHLHLGGGQGHGINSTPEKVKRLTKFFGDEPPLLRLFLRRLGYEKYAGLFEKERIGLLELPFMTEERLHKLGIPLGPRLRILQQAHAAVNPNTLCVL